MSRRATQIGLHMARVLPAPRRAVFEAMTDPDALARWLVPHGSAPAGIDIDPHVGGAYLITMHSRAGEPVHLAGEFREVDPPGRLAYTFRRDDGGPDERQTVVTLSLSPLGEMTELVVDQGAFATENCRAVQERSWSGALDRLAALLEH